MLIIEPIFGQNYSFYGTMSRETLELYLSKAITMSGLVDERSCYSPPCISTPSTLYNPDIYKRDINMINNVDARFIGRSCWLWGGESVINNGYFSNVGAMVNDITNKYADAGKIKPIIQAAIFEIVTTDVNYIEIPDYVATKFGIEKRHFIYNDMFYSDGHYVNQPQNGASVPDMSKLETQMWFYFLATKYIDEGIEAIHMGQVELMDDNDPNHTNWWHLLSIIRDYAKNKNRGLVLLDAHTHGLYFGNTDQLLFDFHSSPLRMHAKLPKWSSAAANGGPAILEYSTSGCEPPYGQMKGGKTYFGWQAATLPYLVEFDNYGIGKYPNKFGNCWVPWGWDEITWFGVQSETYRNDWLKYAYYRVKQLDNNAFLEMPGRRPMTRDNVPWPDIYRADNGFGNQETTIKEIWNKKYDFSLCAPSYYLTNYYNYCGNACWTENTPRLLADVNGDGKDDIIGFANDGVYVSYSDGVSFSIPALKLSYFGYQNGSGWNIATTPRLIGDVNGDGKADIVGFGNNGVMLSLSTGNGFTTPALVLQDFNYNNGNGWTYNHPRFLADVNGDGKDDIIGFGNSGVYVAYSTGNGFTGVSLQVNEFGYNYGNGWDILATPRLIGDVNGDGKADIVGFGNNGVMLSLSTGNGFTTPALVLQDFNYDNGNGWTFNHPRFLADVNGDGKDDIIGFGNEGVYVAYSTGNGFTGVRIAINDYGYEYGNGWNPIDNPRLIGHINSDNKADIVGFGELGTYASVSIGDPNSYYAIMSPFQFYPEYGYGSGNDWLPFKHPRLLGDIDGDGRDEIVGFGYGGVYVMNCDNSNNAFKNCCGGEDTKSKDNNSGVVGIYPNPTRNVLNVRLGSNDSLYRCMYAIYNLLGKNIIKGEMLNSNKIDVSSLPIGIYFITFISRDGVLFGRYKFVIN